MEGLGTGLVDRDGSTMPQTPSWFHPRRCGRGAWTPCVDQTCHSKKPTGHWARVALLWPRRRPRTGKGVKWSEGQSTDPNEATQLFLFHGSSELCKTSFALRRSSSARARLCRPRPHAGRLLVGAVLVGPQLGQVGGRGVPVAVREGALVEVVAVLALPEM